MCPQEGVEVDRFPFSEFSEDVCRLDLSNLDPLQQGVFDYVFYLFSAQRKYRRYAGDVMHAIEGFESLQDYNLARDRYYAVCSKYQRENIQLCYEVKAYTNTKEVGPFGLFDASREDITKQFAVERNSGKLFTLVNDWQINELTRRLAVRALPVDKHTSKKAGQLQLDATNKIMPAVQRSRHRIERLNFNGCLVEFSIIRKRISTTRCIDLRMPNTRKWFFEKYRRGVRGWPGYGRDAAEVTITRENESGVAEEHSGFLQMLPALCNQELGGRLMTQVIGADLRKNEVECFIFPSARCDFFAELQNGDLIDSYGWNLVDYRGAEKPRLPAEEGVVYVTMHDIVFDRHRRFKEASHVNRQKRRDLDDQVTEVRRFTGQEPTTVAVDLYNPWVPPRHDLIGAILTGSEKYLAPEGWEVPLGKYKMILVEDGQQQGSITIEGVQKASAEKEAEQARQYLKGVANG